MVALCPTAEPKAITRPHLLIAIGFDPGYLELALFSCPSSSFISLRGQRRCVPFTSSNESPRDVELRRIGLSK